jgi:putative endonuclease
MAKHIEIGRESEKVATEFLVSKGYRIIETNYRYRNKEIDIIAMLDGLLVVVEVKTAIYEGDERPGDLVNIQKQQYLISAAEAYIMSHQIDTEVRFDIIFVFRKEGNRIEHIEDAFYPLA